MYFRDMEKFNLKLISTYRSALMGIATICILMCHATSNGVNVPILSSVLSLGQIGVLMFFFLSGIGIYYSLNSTNGWRDYLQWYKKRFVRLLIPYILIYGPTLLLQSISNSGGGYDNLELSI